MRALQRGFPALLFVLVLAAFLPAVGGAFLSWDDADNLVGNPHYRGLGPAQLGWIFTAVHMGHYIPVTWLTFAADYLVWGMNPAGYHLTSALYHALNAVLVEPSRMTSTSLWSASLPMRPMLDPTTG